MKRSSPNDAPANQKTEQKTLDENSFMPSHLLEAVYMDALKLRKGLHFHARYQNIIRTPWKLPLEHALRIPSKHLYSRAPILHTANRWDASFQLLHTSRYLSNMIKTPPIVENSRIPSNTSTWIPRTNPRTRTAPIKSIKCGYVHRRNVDAVKPAETETTPGNTRGGGGRGRQPRRPVACTPPLCFPMSPLRPRLATFDRYR